VKYSALRPFIKKFDSYSQYEQKNIVAAIESIKEYLEKDQAPYGLRIKRLSNGIYEARVNIHIRIVYFRDNDIVKFCCLGSHDDIKDFLKRVK
jgi:Txe/YoeB family toxin of Txe-Axe toxin-antitoxin module